MKMPFCTRAMTLMEMMISLVIFLMMIGGVISALQAGRSAWQVNDNTVAVHDAARNVLWSLVQDLRQARGISVNTSVAGKTVVTFTHPTDGTVTYTWTNDLLSPADPVTPAFHVTRAWGARVRTLAHDISAFTVDVTNPSFADVTVTATRTSENRKPSAMTLRQKVRYR